MNTDKLKGMAVVSLAEGAKLGQVDAPLFDAATLHLRAFQVTGDGQTFIVPLEQVRTIGTDAVMVESSQATQTAAKGGEFGTLVAFSTLKQLKVVDAAGTFVGTLHDLELEPTTGRALRIVVHKGGLFGLGGETTTIEAAAIRSVGGELITVAEVGATPTD
jgi:sporulation protein YlmC with PRC-barrel domain